MSDGGIVAIGILVVVGLCGLMIWGYSENAKEWHAFAATHECKIVGRVSGDLLVSPIISGKGGVAITSTPDKTGWLCNDGVTYWRDN